MSDDRQKQVSNEPLNWADWLLDLGKRVQLHMCRGAGIEEASRKYRTSIDTCKLAIAFFCTRDVVKLQAIVEDWSRDRLQGELRDLQEC